MAEKAAAEEEYKKKIAELREFSKQLALRRQDLAAKAKEKQELEARRGCLNPGDEWMFKISGLEPGIEFDDFSHV